MAFVTDALFQDTVAMRRFLHAHPEVGFDLENTAAFVRKRLSEYGVPYTERYGRCSVCALIGDVSGDKPIIALRAGETLAEKTLYFYVSADGKGADE